MLSFPPTVAPTKVLIVPLSSHSDFKPFVRKLSNQLQEIGVSSRVDDSGASIGKRYSRNDELGTPLGITIDVSSFPVPTILWPPDPRQGMHVQKCFTNMAQFQSVKDNTFTLRDRDSTEQVRASLEDICTAISALVSGREKWADVSARLPKFEGQEVD